MAFVVSEGSLRPLGRAQQAAPYSLRLTDDFTQDYAEIWRTQPAVRTVVSFLARNIASLGIHVFRRLSDTDRERLTEHPLAEVIGRPNPMTTRYRLINALVHDLGIFDVAYWLKVKSPQLGLVRMLPQMMTPTNDNWLWPDRFEFRGGVGKREFPADQIVYFRGYNPENDRHGSSPIESLRRTLAEEFEAGRMREGILRNGARVSGYLHRPAGMKWSPGAKERFRSEWHGQYTGSGPEVGGTPILEDGMQFVAASQTAEQLQYVQARKLTREEVAAAYFIPPPMVGILDHATFSNISEQHKMLYQDTLGPWLTMIAEELGLQLLPDFPDTEQVYVEFNLAEKLRGSFEEQAQQLQASVGAPWLTRNEARARNNMRAVDGGDELVTPLNVIVGGQASPRDSAPPPAVEASRTVRGKARAPGTHETKHEQVLRRFFRRQPAVVLSALGAKAAKADDWWNADRWDNELAADLYALAVATSKDVAGEVLDSIGFGPDAYDVDRTLAFLSAVADRVAGSVNFVTKTQLDAALLADDPGDAVRHVFDVAETARAAQIATTAVTAASGFATQEAAKQVAGDQVVKTWRVTSTNPRPSHASMNGETVGVEEAFSNGAQWPGDGVLSVDEVAGCTCAVDITIGEV